VTLAEERDGRQLVAREDPAGRIVGGVEQQGARARRDGRFESARVEPEVGRGERNADELGAGESGRGRVGIVEGLKGDQLVVGVEQGEQRREDRLGGAGVNRDFALRVVVQPIEAALVVGHGARE